MKSMKQRDSPSVPPTQAIENPTAPRMRAKRVNLVFQVVLSESTDLSEIDGFPESTVLSCCSEDLKRKHSGRRKF